MSSGPITTFGAAASSASAVLCERGGLVSNTWRKLGECAEATPHPLSSGCKKKDTVIVGDQLLAWVTARKEV